jgi:hypothetical protein
VLDASIHWTWALSAAVRRPPDAARAVVEVMAGEEDGDPPRMAALQSYCGRGPKAPGPPDRAL